MHTINVALGARAYDVVVAPGAFEVLADRAAALWPNGRAIIIADAHAFECHGDGFLAALNAAGVNGDVITLEPGEARKSFADLEDLCEDLLERNIERSDAIVAFGGGVIGDLVGFAAAITKRGVNFVQVPTTLLAQVDSSVGGKTAINSAAGKNMIGAFHQPSLVIADITVLDTLDPRELRAGYAEIVKIAAMRDAAFFEWLEAKGPKLINGDYELRAEAVARSVQLKADIVAEDEREAGVRALLNFGHTFGHAFEALAGYGGGLKHGEAVAAGMALASDFAISALDCPPEAAARVINALSAAGLEVDPRKLNGAPFDPRATYDAMMGDKKNAGGRIRLVLPERIGAGALWPVKDAKHLKTFLEEQLG